ncbi:hypothetical protein ACFL1Z_01130 [Thermodesulfobacteriota bacterium]
MGSKVMKTRVSEIWQEEDGITRIKTFPNAKMTIDDAIESNEIVNNFSNLKGSILFIDISEIASIDRESRKFFSELENNLAVALLVGSPLSKIIGNFFIGLNKASLPLKLFTSEDEAIRWLKGFLQ